MEQLAAAARSQSGAEELISYHEGSVLAYSGRLRQAKGKAQRAADLARQTSARERAALDETASALWAALFGSASEARRGATAALELSSARDVEYGAAYALALSGDASRSEALVKDLERRFPEDTAARFSYLPIVRARLALNRGQSAKAIELLQIAVPYELSEPHSFIGSFGTSVLSMCVARRIWPRITAPKPPSNFRRILDHPGLIVSDPVSALARLQLGRALVMSGDESRAKGAFEEFLALWRDADPDLPIFKQAKAEYARLQ